MPPAAAHFEDDFLPPAARAVAPYFVLALVILAAYGNIFDNVFLYDDISLIRNNTYLRGWSHIGDILTSSTNSGAQMAGGYYRPLQILLYLVAFHLGDGSTFWFHLLNLSLHTANICFVYRLGTKLGFKPWGVFLAALVWGLHPLHTEAVTYMSATADPLFAFFCLLAIIILLPDISPHKILRIIPLFLLGLFSKETMAMFPLLVMASLFLTSPQRLNIRTYFRTWPLWIIALIYTARRLHANNLFGPQLVTYFSAFPDSTPEKMYSDHAIIRGYTFLATLPGYLKLLAWPTGLHMERAFSVYKDPWDAVVMAGAGICILAAALIIHSCRSNRRIEMSWGLLWFATAYVPDSGILVPANTIFLEHWMYLPSVGLFLGIAETLEQLLQNRSRPFAFACSAAALMFVGVLSVKTYAQNTIWHDPVSFYGNIFKFGETSAMAHSNLVVYYSDEGDYAAAIEQFKQALAVSDTLAETHQNLAATYMRMPDHAEHMQQIMQNYNRALEIDPNFYFAARALGDIYGKLGDQDKAKYYNDRADAILSQYK
jgi:tetratricopeptide (TPR) repeat protein